MYEALVPDHHLPFRNLHPILSSPIPIHLVLVMIGHAQEEGRLVADKVCNNVPQERNLPQVDSLYQ